MFAGALTVIFQLSKGTRMSKEQWQQNWEAKCTPRIQSENENDHQILFLTARCLKPCGSKEPERPLVKLETKSLGNEGNKPDLFSSSEKYA